MKMKNMLLCAIVASSCVAGAAGANAIVMDLKGAANAGGGKTAYTYDVYLGGQSGHQNSLMKGDYFMLFKFCGLTDTPTYSGPYGNQFNKPAIHADGPDASDVVCTYEGGTLTTNRNGADIFLCEITLKSHDACDFSKTPLNFCGNDHGGDCSYRCNNDWICGPSVQLVPASSAGLGGAILLGLLGAAKLLKTRRAAAI